MKSNVFKSYAILGIFACGLPVHVSALPMDMLNIEPGEELCYVQAGADGPGDGSESDPYNSLALVEADDLCDVILVLRSTENNLALDGGIFLDPGQKLFGLGPDVTEPGDGPKKRALITNTGEEDDVDGPINGFYAQNRGVGVILSGDNEVAGVHIDGTYNTAISAVNISSSVAGEPAAKIHHVLITDAANSGDPAFNDFGVFGVEAGIAILSADLTAFPELGGPPAGPLGVSDIEILDTIIRDGIAGIVAVGQFFAIDLTMDNVTIERMSLRKSVGFTPTFALHTYTVEAEQNVTISNSSFLDIDNAGNFVPAILPIVEGDAAHLTYTVNSSTFVNPSQWTSFSPFGDGSPIARGDGFLLAMSGGEAHIELNDFIVANSGQDGVEIEQDFIVGAAPIFAESSLATMTMNRVILKHNGRADIIPVQVIVFPVPDSGPASTGDRQVWTVSDSTFEGGGSLAEDYWNLFGSVIVPYIDETGTRPIGNADNFDIDLGGGGRSAGGNRIYGTTGDIFNIESVDDLTIMAQDNWWGTPDGLDQSRVITPGSTNSGVDADNPLDKDPRPSEGSEDYNNLMTP
jgi:hypothetical protein